MPIAKHALVATVAILYAPLGVSGGRVPADELLMVGYGARQHIRNNALQHLRQEITMIRRSGSVTLEESLAQLVHKGLISADDARTRTGRPKSSKGCYDTRLLRTAYSTISAVFAARVSVSGSLSAPDRARSTYD